MLWKAHFIFTARAGTTNRTMGVDLDSNFVGHSGGAPQEKNCHPRLLRGLLLGCSGALIRDRLSGLVYSVEELRMSMPGPMLERLALKQPRTWPMACELLAQGPLIKAKSIAMIPVGQPDITGVQALETALQSALSERSLLVSDDLVKTRSCDSQAAGSTRSCSRTQLSQLQQSLILQGTPVAGWLLLDPTAEAV